MTYAPLNFTKKAIESLSASPKKQRLYYRDTKIRSLVLMVTDTGVKSFQVYRKMNGKPVRITLGRFPDLSVENARNKAMEANTQLTDGKNPNDEKRKLRQETTFGEIFQQYMTRHAKIRAKSWRNIQARYDMHLIQWNNKRLSSLRKLEVEKQVAYIAENAGQHAANSIITLINAVFNKALEWGWQGVNPAAGVKKFREKARDRFLQPNELPIFFESLEQEPNETARDYIYMSLYTGARKSNVLSMQWKEVNIEQATWRIEETKNGESMTVHLPKPAIDILARRKKQGRNSSYVFPGNGEAGYFYNPQKPWERTLVRAEVFHLLRLIGEHEGWDAAKLTNAKRAVEGNLKQALKKCHEQAKKLKLDITNVGLKDLRIHDLRRSLGSWQAAAGANSYIIGKSLGHKSQQATAIYARLNLDPVRASVDTAVEAMLASVRRG